MNINIFTVTVIPVYCNNYTGNAVFIVIFYFVHGKYYFKKTSMLFESIHINNTPHIN